MKKTQSIDNGRKWSLYGAVLAAMIYSALTLQSQPADAGTCTPTRCQTLQIGCDAFCNGPLKVQYYICPFHVTGAWCQCTNGTHDVFFC